MPTYGYKCPKCGHEYEKLQKMSDNNRAKCPNCGTRGIRVISGGAGVVFKGSGFYETDYKRASASSRPSEDKKSETPKTETKTETKTESKPSEKKSSSEKPKK
jgi:putative FmdB family regulatory protein